MKPGGEGFEESRQIRNIVSAALREVGATAATPAESFDGLFHHLIDVAQEIARSCKNKSDSRVLAGGEQGKHSVGGDQLMGKQLQLVKIAVVKYPHHLSITGGPRGERLEKSARLDLRNQLIQFTITTEKSFRLLLLTLEDPDDLFAGDGEATGQPLGKLVGDAVIGERPLTG